MYMMTSFSRSGDEGGCEDLDEIDSNMPGLSLHVVLSEALEVRGGPLVEEELWAVLTQATEALQDLFLTGQFILFTYISHSQ